MFDIEMMKNTLIELEIDVKKMPLGICHTISFYTICLGHYVSHRTAPRRTRRHLKAS